MTALLPPPHIDAEAGLVDLLRALARSGREQDWGRFIATQGHRLRAVCRHELPQGMLVEDAVQEALIGVQASLPGFRPSSEVEARHWVEAIARNAACNLRRSETARHRRERLSAETVVFNHR